MLEQNGLTLHVTDYEDFGWLINLFASHLSHVNETMKPDSSDRIGIRYIDAILPKPDTPITQYVIPNVLGLSQLGLEGVLQHAYSETIMVNESISTVSRIILRDGPIAFPPDMAVTRDY